MVVEWAAAEAYILDLFRELLARVPPESECEAWIASLLDGTPPAEIRASITGSEEYIDRLWIRAERDAVTRTGLFDASWYVLTHQDVAEAGIDPLDHYVRFGRSEGRAANAYFPVQWYRERAGIPADTDALLDYADRGEGLGLPPGPHFDPVWYRDVYHLESEFSPLAHFLAHRVGGWFAPCRFLWSVANTPFDASTPDGRDRFLPYLAAGAEAPDMALLAASGLFDPNHYLVSNPDVIDAGLPPLFHFCTFGWEEARNPNAYFDIKWYVATNPEVERLRINPLVHYLLVGEPRGRRPMVYFEPDWYRTTNGLSDATSPLAHFLANRHGQHVSPNSLFDPTWFIARTGRGVRRRHDPFSYYLFAGTWNDMLPSAAFDAIAWRKRNRGRRSRHFTGLLHPDKDNPLVDYMLSTYK